MARETISLTDDEGTFLSLLIRVGPATAYQISKIYAKSPVSNFGTSKGKIYPLIRRLRDLGFIRSERVEGDARGSERLECTAAGIEAVRHWVKEIRSNHLLLEDPLRTKVQSFGLLTARERLKWVADAKAALVQKLRDLEEYAAEVEVRSRMSFTIMPSARSNAASSGSTVLAGISSGSPCNFSQEARAPDVLSSA